jgi:hypothetical protein
MPQSPENADSEVDASLAVSQLSISGPDTVSSQASARLEVPEIIVSGPDIVSSHAASSRLQFARSRRRPAMPQIPENADSDGAASLATVRQRSNRRSPGESILPSRNSRTPSLRAVLRVNARGCPFEEKPEPEQEFKVDLFHFNDSTNLSNKDIPAIQDFCSSAIIEALKGLSTNGNTKTKFSYLVCDHGQFIAVGIVINTPSCPHHNSFVPLHAPPAPPFLSYPGLNINADDYVVEASACPFADSWMLKLLLHCYHVRNIVFKGAYHCKSASSSSPDNQESGRTLKCEWNRLLMPKAVAAACKKIDRMNVQKIDSLMEDNNTVDWFLVDATGPWPNDDYIRRYWKLMTRKVANFLKEEGKVLLIFNTANEEAQKTFYSENPKVHLEALLPCERPNLRLAILTLIP